MTKKTSSTRVAKTPATHPLIKIIPKKMVLRVWYEGLKMKSRMMEDL